MTPMMTEERGLQVRVDALEEIVRAVPIERLRKRGNGRGSIYRRNGRDAGRMPWVACISSYDENGVRKKKTRLAWTREGARAKLIELQAEGDATMTKNGPVREIDPIVTASMVRAYCKQARIRPRLSFDEIARRCNLWVADRVNRINSPRFSGTVFQYRGAVPRHHWRKSWAKYLDSHSINEGPTPINAPVTPDAIASILARVSEVSKRVDHHQAYDETQKQSIEKYLDGLNIDRRIEAGQESRQEDKRRWMAAIRDLTERVEELELGGVQSTRGERPRSRLLAPFRKLWSLRHLRLRMPD